MTNQNDDPLIAEVDRIMENLREHEASNVGEIYLLNEFRKLVIADRARQQEEKEKMIAELKRNAMTFYDPQEIMAVTLDDIQKIIQGKEQKEEREASK